MKAYKGFNKDMTCRGFQFEEGKEYHEDTAKLCESGFHACENPLDCFRYYSPATSVYHEVELDDVDSKREDDSKVCGKTIKVGAKLDIAKLCKLHFEYIKRHTTHEIIAENGSASAGNNGSASAGEYGSASAGEYGSASAGNNGSASAGYKGSASAGYKGSASSRGTSVVGKYGSALVRGNNVKAKGGMGAVIVIVNENNNDFNIKEWKAGVVDGETLKPDTWYKLENGEFIECE